MEKKTLYKRLEDWYENATAWQHFLFIAGMIALILLLLVFTTIMPIVWSVRFHKLAYLLIWIIPVSIGAAISVMDENGDIDL